MIKKIDIQQEMYSQILGKELFEQAKSYTYAYMDGVHERNVFPNDEAIKNLVVFDEPFPAMSINPTELLRMLHEYGSPATVTQTGGRYFGFVTGSSVPSALAAKWLSDVWDQNTALYVMSPISSQLEATCEKWLVDLLGLPAGTGAGFVTGSSTANLCGLAAGRNELLNRQGWDVNVDGLFDAPKLRVVLGGQAHATIFKALALLGLGKSRVEIVPTDNQGRMIVDEMPESCLVITQAGNVNTGAFDPIDEICDLARRVNAWVHVDGAFGLWAAGSRTKKILTQGIDKADSWAVDAHKTLNAPYDSGIILCKHSEILVAAMQATAAYIPHGEQRDGMHYTPEMSRRGRVVELWATLKFLGKDGVEELVDRLCDHAKRFAENLRAEGFRILNDVVFNQVLVACDSPEHTKVTLENIQKSGECWCGGSVWNGEPVIRISVCSWATTVADVERSVAAFVNARDRAIFP
ncbi:MAG: aminotransferase class V-fold PLP-dependent enzyme [Methylobacter sp.]|nr:aminotransferase class V-fold PLP-dependent enzyme [Methylobacter sp.]